MGAGGALNRETRHRNWKRKVILESLYSAVFFLLLARGARVADGVDMNWRMFSLHVVTTGWFIPNPPPPPSHAQQMHCVDVYALCIPHCKQKISQVYCF